MSWLPILIALANKYITLGLEKWWVDDVRVYHSGTLVWEVDKPTGDIFINKQEYFNQEAMAVILFPERSRLGRVVQDLRQNPSLAVTNSAKPSMIGGSNPPDFRKKSLILQVTGVFFSSFFFGTVLYSIQTFFFLENGTSGSTEQRK